jgi:hypothetical protein
LPPNEGWAADAVPPGPVARGAVPFLDVTPAQCQWYAAHSATAANRLELKAMEIDTAAARGRPACGSRCGLAALRSEIARLAGWEARSRSAGAARELFYKLAAVEARRALLERGRREIDDDLAKVEGARQRVLALTVSDGDLKRYQLTLAGNALELQMTRDELDTRLQTLLQLGPGDAGRPIRPVAVPGSHDEPVDEANALAVGLAHRPALILLRRLQQTLSTETLPAVHEVLVAAHALLGAESQPHAPC